jgi:hypothetical protein
LGPSVDLLIKDQVVIFISDDKARVIYQVVYDINGK